MAKKLYTEAGGVSHKVKKLYTEVGGVSHKVKKLYAEVGGYSKLVYNSFRPFTYSFSTFANMSPSLNSYCEIHNWYAGYNEDGSIQLNASCWNATGYSGGAPGSRLQVTFIDPSLVAGKTVTITYNQNFDCDKSYNEFWYYDTKDGGNMSASSMYGRSGDGKVFTRQIPLSTNGFAVQIIVGGDGNNTARITITSITVDGEEVLR